MFYNKDNSAIELTKNEAILTMYAGENLSKVMSQTGIKLDEAISAAKSLEEKGIGAFIANYGGQNQNIKIDTSKKDRYRESMMQHYRKMISES